LLGVPEEGQKRRGSLWLGTTTSSTTIRWKGRLERI
jgi:hypothetical protein